MTATVGDGKVARAGVASPARAGLWWRRLVVALSGLLNTLGEPLRHPGVAGDGGSRFVPVRKGPAPWTTPPPSLDALHRYTSGGEWVPGERAPVLEFLGKAYGYLISIPVHAAAYAVLWLVARPTRLLLAVVIVAALRWTAS